MILPARKKAQKVLETRPGPFWIKLKYHVTALSQVYGKIAKISPSMYKPLQI